MTIFYYTIGGIAVGLLLCFIGWVIAQCVQEMEEPNVDEAVDSVRAKLGELK